MWIGRECHSLRNGGGFASVGSGFGWGLLRLGWMIAVVVAAASSFLVWPLSSLVQGRHKNGSTFKYTRQVHELFHTCKYLCKVAETSLTSLQAVNADTCRYAGNKILISNNITVIQRHLPSIQHTRSINNPSIKAVNKYTRSYIMKHR